MQIYQLARTLGHGTMRESADVDPGFTVDSSISKTPMQSVGFAFYCVSG
jgi:hypothetical protein